MVSMLSENEPSGAAWVLGHPRVTIQSAATHRIDFRWAAPQHRRMRGHLIFSSVVATVRSMGEHADRWTLRTITLVVNWMGHAGVATDVSSPDNGSRIEK